MFAGLDGVLGYGVTAKLGNPIHIQKATSSLQEHHK